MENVERRGSTVNANGTNAGRGRDPCRARAGGGDVVEAEQDGPGPRGVEGHGAQPNRAPVAITGWGAGSNGALGVDEIEVVAAVAAAHLDIREGGIDRLTVGA